MTAHRQETPLPRSHKRWRFKLLGGLALTAGYWCGVRRRFSQWGGATPEELARPMAGGPDAAAKAYVLMVGLRVA